jgi:hypothetical protein
VTGTGGRGRKQLLVGLEEEIGYWKLEEEALDRAVWRTGFGRGCGPTGRQTDKRSARAFLHVLIRTGRG